MPSARNRREEQLKTEIARVHRDNGGVYGARTIWVTPNREGIPVARCTVERLMTELGSGRSPTRQAGAYHPRRHGSAPTADLVRRDVDLPAPNRTWVADLTSCADSGGHGLSRPGP